MNPGSSGLLAQDREFDEVVVDCHERLVEHLKYSRTKLAFFCPGAIELIILLVLHRGLRTKQIPQFFNLRDRDRRSNVRRYGARCALGCHCSCVFLSALSSSSLFNWLRKCASIYRSSNKRVQIFWPSQCRSYHRRGIGHFPLPNFWDYQRITIFLWWFTKTSKI